MVEFLNFRHFSSLFVTLVRRCRIETGSSKIRNRENAMKLRSKILLLYVAIGLLILLSIGSFVSSRLKDEMADIPANLAEEAVDRIKEPAEMGDVTQIKSIVAELRSKSDAFAFIGDQFVQLAEDFDFEGIAKLVGELERIAKSG
jgi:hypothetical protein